MNEFTREERTATTAIPASDPFGTARRPAPAARIDEDFVPRTASQPLVPGDTYNIEPNDNFWTISRKQEVWNRAVFHGSVAAQPVGR